MFFIFSSLSILLKSRIGILVFDFLRLFLTEKSTLFCEFFLFKIFFLRTDSKNSGFSSSIPIFFKFIIPFLLLILDCLIAEVNNSLICDLVVNLLK